MLNNLSQKSQSELEALYIDNLKKAMDLRFMLSRGTSQVKVHKLSQIRKENARIKQVLQQIRDNSGN